MTKTQPTSKLKTADNKASQDYSAATALLKTLVKTPHVRFKIVKGVVETVAPYLAPVDVLGTLADLYGNGRNKKAPKIAKLFAQVSADCAKRTKGGTNDAIVELQGYYGDILNFRPAATGKGFVIEPKPKAAKRTP